MTARTYGGTVQAVRRITDADVPSVVSFAVEAWAPVFASLEAQMGPDVFGDIYPNWRVSQAAAVEGVCTAPENDVWVATVDDRAVGFVAVSIVEEDAARAGEIVMVAVHPDHQGDGIAVALVQHALDAIKAQGIGLAVVATGGDPGHAPARALYERFGFTPLPLVRYYRRL
jgi:ribosomal protein S18 acetylase RimI-like enzyme